MENINNIVKSEIDDNLMVNDSFSGDFEARNVEAVEEINPMIIKE